MEIKKKINFGVLPYAVIPVETGFAKIVISNSPVLLNLNENCFAFSLKCSITGFDQKTEKRRPYSNVNYPVTFSLFDDNEKKNCLDLINPKGMTRL